MNIVVTGSKGMLGSMLIKKLKMKGHQIIDLDLPEYDLTKLNSLDFLKQAKLDFIYNCAAFTAVDRCETEYNLAYAVNVSAVKNILQLGLNVPFLQVSTDYVFDGKANDPYKTDTVPNPVSAYGRTKAEGEKAVQESGQDKYFIVRTAWLYGPNGKNFVKTIVNNARTKPELKIVNDQKGSPTYTEDFAEALVKFLDCTDYGVYHYTNSGETTWYNFAKYILDYMGIDTPIIPCTTKEYPTPAQRPVYSVLDLSKIKNVLNIDIPSWQDAVQRYLDLKEL